MILPPVRCHSERSEESLRIRSLSGVLQKNRPGWSMAAADRTSPTGVISRGALALFGFTLPRELSAQQTEG